MLAERVARFQFGSLARVWVIARSRAHECASAVREARAYVMLPPQSRASGSAKERWVIEGVEIKKLTTFADERGALTEIVRNDDPFFVKFGQCYVSISYPGVIRAWHYHKKQTDYFCCIKG